MTMFNIHITPISSKKTKNTQTPRIRAIGKLESTCAATMIAPIAITMF